MTGTQTDNGDTESKLMVRRHLMKSLNIPESELRVIELFGGLGVLYDELYTGVKKHIAIEKRKVHRPTWIQGDTYTLFPAFINGNTPWDLYDVDTYDNPWVLMNQIMGIAHPGVFAITGTCGIRRGLGNGKTNGFIRQTSGMNGISDTRLATRWYDDVIRWAVQPWEAKGVRIIETVRAKSIYNVSNNVWYWGFIVEKT